MELPILMYADGADLDHIRSFVEDPRVAGFTTNPTLMRKAGIADYRAFALEALAVVAPRPISFEVFADNPADMMSQARDIASWGANVYVKIPVTNTKGEFTDDVIRTLSAEGVQLNVTAIMTVAQVERVAEALSPTTASVVSVFAGRIADAGVDPIPLMKAAKRALVHRTEAQLLWASPREILNLLQAAECGCDIITMTSDLWTKIAGLGKDLDQFSLETVQMFHADAQHAGYAL